MRNLHPIEQNHILQLGGIPHNRATADQRVAAGDRRIETGLKKCGAMLGDLVEIGCGSVLNPGTVIGRESSVYPLSMVRGFIPAGHIYKCRSEIAEKQNR